MAEVKWCKEQIFGLYGLLGVCGGEMCSAAASNGLRDWTIWSCAKCGSYVSEDVAPRAISYDEAIPPTQRAAPALVNHCHLCGRDARPSTCGAKLCSTCGIWLSACDTKCGSQHILSAQDDGPPTDRMRRAS